LLSLPTSTPERSQPSHRVCNSTAYAGGEESGCIDQCIVYAGDTSFAPWTVSGTSLKIRCGYQNGWYPATSDCFFDLTGAILEYGELSATVDTVVGQTYTILFNYGTTNEASQIYNLYVNLDGVLFYTATAIPGVDNWNLVTISFTANLTSYTITLFSDQGFDDMGAYIDSPRIYTCVNQPRPWCLKSYNTIETCGTDTTVIDYQQTLCGCNNAVMNGDCLSLIWNFSLAEQCAADDDTGVFGTCESRPSSVVTRASIGECVETEDSGLAILYQSSSAYSARKREIPGTLGGYPVMEYLYIKCGECVGLPNTTLYAKVTCSNKKVSYFVDSSCTYAVSEEYVMDQYASIEYSSEYVFILTATDNPEKCEMVSVGQNCSMETRVNTSIEHSCWSESTYLPPGTFDGSPYKSFRINCPSKQIQFYSTTTCTGPIQYTDGTTEHCRIPHITVNISVQNDLLCGCGLGNNASSSSYVSSNSVQTSSVETSALESSSFLSNSNALPSSSEANSSEQSETQMVSDSLPASSVSQSEPNMTQTTSGIETSDLVASGSIPSSETPTSEPIPSFMSESTDTSSSQPESSIPLSSSENLIISESQFSSSAPEPSSSSPTTPWTTTTGETDACFMEFSDSNCSMPMDYYAAMKNTCNPINGISTFGAYLNTTVVTTYVYQNCSIVSNAFAYGVCVQFLSPYLHWGMFTLGVCFNVTPTYPSSDIFSSTEQPTSVVTSNIVLTSSDQISSISQETFIVTSAVVQTSEPISTLDQTNSNPATSELLTSVLLPSSLPASSGLFLYLPHTSHINL